MNTRLTTLELIKNDLAIAKMVECAWNDDIHIKYIINQLIDPEYNRPYKKLKKYANRNKYFDTVTGDWKYRGRYWTSNYEKQIIWRDYNIQYRGLPKSTSFTKRTSTTSVPSHGKIDLINYIFKNPTSCVVLLFDVTQCSLNPKFIFDADVNTDVKWWIENNSSRSVSYATTYEKIKAAQRVDARNNSTSKLNEILAELSKNALSGVAAPSDTLFSRLNTLRVGYYIKIRLLKPIIDFLIITPGEGVENYTHRQQAIDIFEALDKAGDVFSIACHLLHYASIMDKIIKFINHHATTDISRKFILRLIKARQFDAAIEVLSRCPNIDLYYHDNTNGYTFWHYAVMYNQPALLNELTKYAGSPGLTRLNPENHRSPLAIALYNYRFTNHTIDINEILNCFDQLRNKNSREQSASILLDLARAGWEEYTLFFLKRSASIAIDLTDYTTGNTALHYAVIHDQSKLVIQLLDLNASAGIKNKKKRTPLSIALYNKSYHLVDIILEKQLPAYAALNANELGVLLLYCMQTKKYIYAQFILKNADINNINIQCRDEKSRNTSLHYAVLDSRPEEAKILCAKSNIINFKNKEGHTPLDLAFQNHLYDLAAEMVNLSLNVISENKMGLVIFNFVLGDKPDTVRFILDNRPYSASGGYDASTNNTTLHFAVMKGYLEVVQRLCEAGEKIHICNKKQETPLSLALSYNQPKHDEIAKSILKISFNQLTDFEIKDCILQLIKRNALGVNFLDEIKFQLNIKQTFFYIDSLFTHIQNIFEIFDALEKMKRMNINYINQGEGLNLINKLAKTRILRLSLESIHDIDKHGISMEQIEAFLNKHSDNLFTFFYNTDSFNTFKKIQKNDIEANDEILQAEKTCRAKIHALK